MSKLGGVSPVTPPNFTYLYPDWIPVKAQHAMANVQKRADKQFRLTYQKRAASLETFKARPVRWFRRLVVAYAGVMGRVPRSLPLSAKDRMVELYRYVWSVAKAAGLKAADDQHYSPEALPSPARLIGQNVWRALVVRATRADTVPRNPPRRIPKLDVSQKRIELHRRLLAELVTIKARLRTYCEDVSTLKAEYPDFELWKHIRQDELDEIHSDERFSPRSYARTITLRASGVSSPETLKKDRKKLKKASESGSR